LLEKDQTVSVDSMECCLTDAFPSSAWAEAPWRREQGNDYLENCDRLHVVGIPGGEPVKSCRCGSDADQYCHDEIDGGGWSDSGPLARRLGWWLGVGAGLLAGALIGGAIATSTYPYYGAYGAPYYYGNSYPQYGYYYPRTAYYGYGPYYGYRPYYRSYGYYRPYRVHHYHRWHRRW
jgi:hypothetical protein